MRRPSSTEGRWTVVDGKEAEWWRGGEYGDRGFDAWHRDQPGRAVYEQEGSASSYGSVYWRPSDFDQSIHWVMRSFESPANIERLLILLAHLIGDETLWLYTST